jgi:hypothetical protein
MLRALLCAVVCLFVFSSAKADTFTLTSGALATGFDLFNINASGPNISIHGATGGEPGNTTFATCTPAPCAAGSLLNVGGTVLPHQLNIPFSPATVTINGVTFTDVVFSGGDLTFTGSVVLPNNYVTGQPFSVPFTMTGHLVGFLPCPGDFNCFQQQLFDISINGSGIAIVTIPQFGERISSVSYVFSSPVPEPATLGLFGVGLLALNTLRKRRRY